MTWNHKAQLKIGPKGRPFRIDPPWVVVKRLEFARNVMRARIFGTYPLPCPCLGDFHKNYGTKTRKWYCREMSWAFAIRRMVASRAYTYQEIEEQAELLGQRLESEDARRVPKTLDQDNDVLKRFVTILQDKAKAENRWERGRAAQKAEMSRDLAEKESIAIAMTGVCPSCGADLPCAQCQIPSVEWRDGKVAVKELPPVLS